MDCGCLGLKDFVAICSVDKWMHGVLQLVVNLPWTYVSFTQMIYMDSVIRHINYYLSSQQSFNPSNEIFC